MEPEPELVDALDSIENILAYTSVGLVATLILVTILVWAIYRSARYRPEAMLVIVLGVLALVSAIGYLVGGDGRAELVTLAATAVGALAGALTIMANAVVAKNNPPPFQDTQQETRDGKAEANDQEDPAADAGDEAE